ncbi:MAG: thiamine pyrophosphate-binding protein [Salinigranum sp.]
MVEDEASGPSAERVDGSGQEWGSDFVADLLAAYGFDYVPFNPGASFRGIEESLVNYAEDGPEVVLTPNEGLTVSIAHGYAKATNEPSVCILHDIVGTLNGAMGIYNAYVDRVPMLILAGNGPVRKSKRRPWIDWIHTATDQGSLVREYTKWDDQPAHVDGVADSIVRGYNIAGTVPHGPVYVTLDHDVQENRLEEPMALPDFERVGPPSSVAPDPAAVETAASLLVDAEFPVFVVSRVGRAPETVDALVELAELLGAAVVETRKRDRYNFPTTHPLNLSGADVYDRADVLVTLDVDSVEQFLVEADQATHERRPALPEEPTLIDVGPGDLGASSLTGDYCALHGADLSILADTALAVPALREAVTDAVAGDDGFAARAARRTEEIERIHRDLRAEWRAEVEAAWDETPISLPRLAAEIWEVLRDEQWVLVNGTLRKWTHRLWEIDEYDRYVGGYSGGGGVGYGVGGAIGGALAYADTDRIPINLQSDGDLISNLGGLWTQAHSEIPMLTVVHNNRALYNSTNHRMKLAAYRGREASYERSLIGTGLTDPVPDYASAAESVGVNGYGPIERPDDLRPALEDALADVKAGEPALVDVVSQPR